MISSLQNDRIKLAHALQTQPKARRKEGKIVLEGARLVLDAVERGGIVPEFVLFEPEHASPSLIEHLESQHVPLFPVSDDVMRHVTTTEQPQGVVGVFPTPAVVLPDQPSRLLILDDIRDPGNLGTMLRTAAASGVDAVLLSPGCVDLYNPKVLRSAMGAHFRVPAAELRWSQIDAVCQHTVVYLADMDGDAAYDRVDWLSEWSLIIGSEAHGASKEALELTHSRVTIPMAADTESLNAAVAAGILLFEAQRQRRASE